MKKYEHTIDNFLNEGAKKRIEECVEAVEKKTSAEIKILVVSNSRPFRIIPRLKEKDKRNDVLRRAKKEYKKLGIGNTRDDTGVLIMISLAEKMVYVLAGHAINEKVSETMWSEMVEKIVKGIDCKCPEFGVCQSISHIGDTLAFLFPVKEDDVNEIDDVIVIKK